MSTNSTTPLPQKLAAVLESCLYAADLAAAERFYTEILGLALHSRQEGRHLFLRCGSQMVLLFNAAEASQRGDLDIPTHGATGEGHLCFAMPEAKLAGWIDHLKRHGVAIEKIFDWPGGGRSVYFRDPAGNSLELASPRIWGLDDS
ncbi:MAG: VOC family protein [Pirellulaceae bacterium]